MRPLHLPRDQPRMIGAHDPCPDHPNPDAHPRGSSSRARPAAKLLKDEGLSRRRQRSHAFVAVHKEHADAYIRAVTADAVGPPRRASKD
jgi:hypothetical protein